MAVKTAFACAAQTQRVADWLERGAWHRRTLGTRRWTQLALLARCRSTSGPWPAHCMRSMQTQDAVECCIFRSAPKAISHSAIYIHANARPNVSDTAAARVRFTPGYAQGVWCKGGRSPVSPPHLSGLFHQESLRTLRRRLLPAHRPGRSNRPHPTPSDQRDTGRLARDGARRGRLVRGH